MRELTDATHRLGASGWRRAARSRESLLLSAGDHQGNTWARPQQCYTISFRYSLCAPFPNPPCSKSTAEVLWRSILWFATAQEGGRRLTPASESTWAASPWAAGRVGGRPTRHSLPAQVTSGWGRAQPPP
jgi:hypothetical protein